jgi:hypothetical protein
MSLNRVAVSFEDVYLPRLPPDTPFYALAGNHDHLGDVTMQVRNPVEISSRTTNSPSNFEPRAKIPVRIMGRIDKGNERKWLRNWGGNWVIMQLAYAALQPQWNFPHLYHTFTQRPADRAAPGPSVQVVVIDTMVRRTTKPCRCSLFRRSSLLPAMTAAGGYIWP